VKSIHHESWASCINELSPEVRAAWAGTWHISTLTRLTDDHCAPASNLAITARPARLDCGPPSTTSAPARYAIGPQRNAGQNPPLRHHARSSLEITFVS
jgi:hypothetical protein